MKTFLKLGLLAFCAICGVPAQAETTYYVSAETGSDDNNGLTWNTATKSIQKAISYCHPGDSILVNDGVYSAITISSGPISISSVSGSSKTTIDGKNNTRCVDSSSKDNTITGFTIQNGRCSGSSSSGAKDGGAGIRTVTAIDCILSNNSGSIRGWVGTTYYNGALGGGAYNAILKRCRLSDNYAYGAGGAAANSYLENCVLFNNSCNESYSGTGTFDCDLRHCTVVNDTTIGGTAINSITTGEWRSSTETQFCAVVSDSVFVDAMNNDYHLKNDSSPVDVGSMDYVLSDDDLDGNPRVSRIGVDLGCYECTTPIPPSISANGGSWVSSIHNIVEISSINTNGVLYYAINDGAYTCANAQSINLTTTETIHVRAYVLAYDRFQSEIVEADIVKVEPCAVVEGATATWNEAETEVAVEWTVQPEAFTYAVYRGEDDDFANATQLTNNLESCRYVDEPGDSDLVYYYWVVGENELGPGQVGEAVATRWAQVATPTISPEDGTRFGTASKKVMFSCATAGVKFHYTIDGSEPTTNSPTASAFTLKDTATVKVVAVKNRMRNSEVASATITRVRVAPPPALGPAVQSGAGLNIAWGAVDEAESYEVYRGRSPDFAAAQSLGETEETEWTDATAEAGVPYYYFVVSKNIAGTSDAGDPALGATLTLATAVNAPQLVFATGADCPWTAIATNGAVDGAHQATSGTPADSAESWLETSVTGPGQITFQWKSSCEKDDTGECEWDHLAFRVDGDDLARLDGRTRWAEVSLPIAGGDHVLRWVYAKDEGMSEGEDYGALDCVQWIPDETKGDWEKWVDCYGLLTESGYEALKQNPSGKGDTLYEEFVAGLNPLDPLSRFRARINASVEPPSISWNPDLGGARTYTVEGKPTLTNETWTAPTGNSRFYRVRVKEPGN